MTHSPLHSHRARLALALIVSVVTALLVSLDVTAHASAAGTCALSSISESSQSGCWQPFASNSPFNEELPSAPALASDSSAVLSHMEQYAWSFNGSNSGFSLSMNEATRPVYFATPSDPTLTINCTVCHGDNGVNVSGAQINVPAGAVVNGDTDEHFTVVETATGLEYDFWLASISGSTITAHVAAVVNTNTGNGLGSEGDAAHFALTAGLLRPSELASGVINHALVITVPCTNANGMSVGYTWPANGGWGDPCGENGNESTTGAPELGQLVRLNLSDAQIAASPAPAWEKTVMTALAHYGAYIEDTDSNYANGMDILMQDPASFTSIGLPNQWTAVAQQYGSTNGVLSSNVPIPVSDLEVVNACVTQGTCPGLSGPTATGTTEPTAIGGSTAAAGQSAPTTTSAPTTSSSSGSASTSAGAPVASAPTHTTGAPVKVGGGHRNGRSRRSARVRRALSRRHAARAHMRQDRLRRDHARRR